MKNIHNILNRISGELVSNKIKVAIIEKAKENDVPLYKDNKLADTLSKLKIGDAIPPELYDVVAEILVFVDDMDRLKAKLDGKKK